MVTPQGLASQRARLNALPQQNEQSYVRKGLSGVSSAGTLAD